MGWIDATQQALEEFAATRAWEQYHSPRNLAESVSIEAAELLELFQWGREPDPEQLAEEIADVAIYLLRLCDIAGVDLADAVARKVESNGRKYPA